MDTRLAGWKVKALSLAGRVTLAHSVLSAIPAYVMQTSVLPVDTCKEIDKRIRAFVWGDAADQKKTHLLSWDLICRPKEEGGLGLRSARSLNLAYLVKLAFSFYQHPESLWAKLLLSKYLKEVAGDFLPTHRSSQSAVWKGICSVWPIMMQGSRVGIRDGCNTPFWSARWVDSGAVLEVFADRLDPFFNPLDMVSDFATEDGQWDIDKLNQLLPAEVVTQVVGMSAPRGSSGEDVWLWGAEKDGLFSIRSAYNLVISHSVEELDTLWKLIWKWRGPSRIGAFLWLAGHGRLLTNAERVRRHMASDASCSRCGHESESLSHTLWDCPFAREVWKHLGFNTSTPYWITDFPDWFKVALGGQQAVLVGITLWFIWKSRNEFLFAAKRESAETVARRTSNWKLQVELAMARDIRLHPVQGTRVDAQISWKPGSVNWVTVNVDGSVLRGPTRAAAGGAVRTEDGRAVGAFVANLGSCSVTRAELRGAVLGLELAWSMGYRFVELQLDSRAAIALIQQTGEPSHQHALEVLACQELCRRSWVVKIQHTYREGNKVADFLANRGHEFPFGVFLFPISDCNL
ncbi:Putative ribonuclease H protein At1g65750 [Linum perenne]